MRYFRCYSFCNHLSNNLHSSIATIIKIISIFPHTQLILQRKLGRTFSLDNGIVEEEEEEEKDGEEGGEMVEDSQKDAVPHIQTDLSRPLLNSSSSTSTPTTPLDSATAPPPSNVTSVLVKRQSLHGEPSVDSIGLAGSRERRLSQRLRRNSSRGILPRKFSSASIRAQESMSPDSLAQQVRSGSLEGRGSTISYHSGVYATSSSHDDDLIRPEWVFDQIELSDSDSDLEFFDAKGQ